MLTSQFPGWCFNAVCLHLCQTSCHKGIFFDWLDPNSIGQSWVIIVIMISKECSQAETTIDCTSHPSKLGFKNLTIHTAFPGTNLDDPWCRRVQFYCWIILSFFGVTVKLRTWTKSQQEWRGSQFHWCQKLWNNAFENVYDSRLRWHNTHQYTSIEEALKMCTIWSLWSASVQVQVAWPRTCSRFDGFEEPVLPWDSPFLRMASPFDSSLCGWT